MQPNQDLVCLPPIAKPDARVLILGTMPGAKSLQQQEYYANPGNAFWSIMARLFGISRRDSYAARCTQLTARSVALWDVLSHCSRRGSADSTICNPHANNFAEFYAAYPHIKQVFFASAAAEMYYMKLVIRLDYFPNNFLRLPSPSGAYARLVEWKIARWQVVKNAVQQYEN